MKGQCPEEAQLLTASGATFPAVIYTKWVDEYYSTIASEECVPVGFAMNPAIAAILPTMVAPSPDAEAIKRARESARWYGYSLGHYMGRAPHSPGVTDLWAEFETVLAQPVR